MGRKDVALILAQNLAMENLRSNKGKAGREKFEKEFTLEVFEKRMTRILEHIVYPLFSKKSAIFCMFEYLYITLTRKYKPLILFRI